MRLQFILSFILLLAFGSTALAAKLCVHIFEPFVVTAEVQKHIDATILDLAKFRIALDISKAQGKESVEFVTLKANYDSKEKELGRFLNENGIMSNAQLQEGIKLEIRRIQISQKRQSRKENYIRENRMREINKDIDGSRIVMQNVQPGIFEAGPPNRKKTVQLSYWFDMAATLTTQLVWRKVAELAVKYFGTQSGIEPSPSLWKEDLNPVESVSYVQVQNWIANLNALSLRGVPELHDLIPGFKHGDVFRLPSEAEWEFVARGGLKDRSESYAENNYTLLHQQEWTSKNAYGTRPVATKSPLILDGVAFYDVLGNVREYVFDAYDAEIRGGLNPFVSPNSGNALRVVRGGSYDHPPTDSTPYKRDSIIPTKNPQNTGFRLVREH